MQKSTTLKHVKITEARSEGGIELKFVRKPPKVSRGCGGGARAASGPLKHNLRRSATEAQLGLEFESAWSIEFEFEF